jgi:molecular chaperone DnaJ
VTTLYAVLGVEPDADTVTIRRAYRALARRHHPDFGGDTRQMVVINDAWHTLRDPERRARYNRQLRRARPKKKPGDDHTVMDWGPYEGWSLAEIAKIDENYLLWLSRMPVGRPLQREIKQVLDERTAAEAPTDAAPAARKRGRFSPR